MSFQSRGWDDTLFYALKKQIVAESFAIKENFYNFGKNYKCKEPNCEIN